MQLTALLCCPAMFTRRGGEVIEPESLQGVAYPTIVAKDEIYQIVVDNKYLCYTKYLITAMTAMICCYYIFNICYPASSNDTLSFVQKVFLGIGGSLLGNCHYWSDLFLDIAESDPSTPFGPGFIN